VILTLTFCSLAKINRKSSARKDNYRKKFTTEDMLATVNRVTNEGRIGPDNAKGSHKTGAPGRPAVLSKFKEVLVSRIVLFGQ
jgi:hypothetical protein